MNPHKAGIRSFVVKNKRDRFTEGISNLRIRRKLLNQLAHNNNLIDEKYAIVSSKALLTVKQLYDQLLSMGSPAQVYIVSENVDLDQKLMNLNAALKEIRWSGYGTVISCIPGKLAYYEGEEEHFILQVNSKR
jgi:hypothetical protein